MTSLKMRGNRFAPPQGQASFSVGQNHLSGDMDIVSESAKRLVETFIFPIFTIFIHFSGTRNPTQITQAMDLFNWAVPSS